MMKKIDSLCDVEQDTGMSLVQGYSGQIRSNVDDKKTGENDVCSVNVSTR